MLLFDEHPRPWAYELDEEQWEIFDVDGNSVFYARRGETSRTAVAKIVKIINSYEDEEW